VSAGVSERSGRPRDEDGRGAGEATERTRDTVSTLLRVCALADLGEDSALGVELDVPGEKAPLPVCVARSGGEVYALRDECSHADVQLSAGEVEDGKIECWLHGSQFDLVSGKPTCLPAIDAVPTYPVTIESGDVYVDVAVLK
jgi:3-phenylpropionate/trans-cinnamate dioxygenase ferredoxin component